MPTQIKKSIEYRKNFDKFKIIDNAMKEIKSKYGEGAIMKLGEVRRVDVDVIPTGSISLDIALGVWGVPRGRIIEIFGPESSGKTTLALHILAEAQKKQGLGAFIDAEHALDPSYARRIGVKIDDLLISQPDSGEQALEIVETLVRSGVIDVIVVDSVAALTPRAEIEGEMGESHIGLQARLMSQALRKLTSLVAKTKTVLIFTNQIRQQIGVIFGNPETTPGGKALKFYSSVRIEVRRAAKVQSGEKIIGNRIIAKVVKNKVAPPFQQAEFDILYNEGISRYSDLINTGIKHGILTKSGAWYNFDKIKLGQGLDSAKQFLKDNPKIFLEISKKLRDKILREV